MPYALKPYKINPATNNNQYGHICIKYKEDNNYGLARIFT